MTHPALYSTEDSLSALDAALKTADLTIMQRRVLEDMRQDLERALDFATFGEVVDFAIRQARNRTY